DMEFVQFHPTGMVWPPGVMGILVTEGVRGEGGILRNKDGERFMWKYLPEERRAEYAADDAEASRWVTALSQGRESKDARRPPELSTRDNVARAIYTEVKEGRGSPHGGVFLDISYLPPDHVRRKLPSMYDQFKELADVDITKGPMEVGPTTHYVMGGIRVDAETGAATVPGLFAAGESSGGMHGSNRLGGNSLSDLLVFGARTGEGAAAYAAGKPDAYADPVQVAQAARALQAPLDRQGGEDPYAVQRDLQATMQSLVGIFRVDADLAEAIDRLAELRTRWANIGVKGGRAYNPGWNLVFELGHLLTVSEAITRSARLRTESRGAHSRIDFPATDDAGWGDKNSVIRRARDGSMEVRTAPLPKMAAELSALLGTH
ncbi:MAG TPA: FAD-binding protein, partial [Candidatus Limnocylindrales bacterium]